MVILQFCVIKIYYLRNYRGMAVNYLNKKFYKIGPMVAILNPGATLNAAVIYNGILTLENVGNAVNYHGIL